MSSGTWRGDPAGLGETAPALRADARRQRSTRMPTLVPMNSAMPHTTIGHRRDHPDRGGGGAGLAVGSGGADRAPDGASMGGAGATWVTAASRAAFTARARNVTRSVLQ
jgi:hypothetical protein